MVPQLRRLFRGSWNLNGGPQSFAELMGPPDCYELGTTSGGLPVGA